MIIWKGWGVLAILIPLICSLLAQLAFDSLSGDGFYKESDWAMPLVISLSSILVFVVGYKLNNKQGRILIDPENNEQVELKETHSMFWIPLQYWGIIVFVISAWMYVANLGLIYQ